MKSSIYWTDPSLMIDVNLKHWTYPLANCNSWPAFWSLSNGNTSLQILYNVNVLLLDMFALLECSSFQNQLTEHDSRKNQFVDVPHRLQVYENYLNKTSFHIAMDDRKLVSASLGPSTSAIVESVNLRFWWFNRFMILSFQDNPVASNSSTPGKMSQPPFGTTIAHLQGLSK